MTSGNFGVGLACCAVSAVGFGSNYLPVKKVDVGDGFFFAVCMAIGIGIIGLTVNFSELTTGSLFEGPTFRPMAMLGGAAWMLGNLLTPTIIRLIGLGVGLSIWDLSNMVMGWATGYFGLFGVWATPAATSWLNFFGMGLAGVSLVVLAQSIEEPEAPEKVGGRAIEPDGSATPSATGGVYQECGRPAGSPPPLPSSALGQGAQGRRGASGCSEPAPEPSISTTPTLGRDVSANACREDSNPCRSKGDCEAQKPRPARHTCALGISLALLAGILFGCTFDTSTVMVQRALMGDTRSSSNDLDYVCSNYIGIVVTAVGSFVVYLCVMRKAAFVRSEVIVPGIASGMLLGVAQAAWFKANEELSMVLAFPLISALPGIVALFWGVCFFGELRSRRSRRFAAWALALRVPSVVCIAVSGCSF